MSANSWPAATVGRMLYKVCGKDYWERAVGENESAGDSLNAFYHLIRKRISISTFRTRFEVFRQLQRSKNDLRNIRLARSPWKKFTDEVTPVFRYLKFQKIRSGDICFPLNDKSPDCLLWQQSGEEPRYIEVTIARGRERYHLGKELEEKGTGRGHIGISDDANEAEFGRAMAKPTVMYSTDQALTAGKEGILRCLKRKSDKNKYKGYYLLVIQTSLTALPIQRWEAIRADLAIAAKRSPFSNIVVISDGNLRNAGFQIKPS